MFITKYSITMNTTSNNSSTGGYFYSTGNYPNGFIHAVEYVKGTTAFPSTGVFNLYVGSTVREVLEKTVSADSWIVYPRKQVVDTTAALIGASTDFPAVPIPVSGDARFVAGITGGTSGAQEGVLNVYVQGV